MSNTLEMAIAAFEPSRAYGEWIVRDRLAEDQERRYLIRLTQDRGWQPRLKECMENYDERLDDDTFRYEVSIGTLPSTATKPAAGRIVSNPDTVPESVCKQAYEQGTLF